jgi:alpha-glucosidase
MSEREWWRGAALYQIYPASFYDSNGDGWGDLAGIVRKLDYVQRLCVDGFWLQSILPSPMADHGYDVTEYRDVNPLFGSLDDFDRLLQQTHARGLRLVLDQVYGHTSNRHPWFIASRRHRDGAYGNWYVWADPKPDGTEPNNWRSMSCGPAWTWDQVRSQYFMHHWLPSMPHLNHHEPAVRAEILDVARFWLARGVDGLRLDVLNSLVVDAELRDNPPVGDRSRTRYGRRKWSTMLRGLSASSSFAIFGASRIRSATGCCSARCTASEPCRTGWTTAARLTCSTRHITFLETLTARNTRQLTRRSPSACAGKSSHGTGRARGRPGPSAPMTRRVYARAWVVNTRHSGSRRR